MLLQKSLLPSTIILTKLPYRGLGAEIARRFAAEGSNVAINYMSSSGPAEALAAELQQNHGVKAITIQGDCGDHSAIERCVSETLKAFGGLDILIGNAGWTRFSNFADLDALSYEEWDRCWKTNVTGMHALLKEALPTFQQNPDGGVFILTSSIAGRTMSGSSMAYSVTKAAQLHLVKCLAQTQAPKVRVNAVLPGLLLTDWGNQFGEERIQKLKDAAALKKEVRGINSKRNGREC